MRAERTFEVVLVAPGKPVGFAPARAAKPDATVRYRGAAVDIKL